MTIVPTIPQQPTDSNRQPTGSKPATVQAGPTADRQPTNKGQAITGVLIGIGLALVIIAPTAMSSQDLVAWAKSPTGLGAKGPWPYIAFVSLDLAALVCVGMVTYAALWRRERAGMFSLLVWAFAGGSALFNYKHGIHTIAADDEIFYPAMSLAGPLLLEFTIGKLKRWFGKDQGHYSPALPHFGWSWLPGVAFNDTRRAWAVSARHGISDPRTAMTFLREQRAVSHLSEVDALHYAFSALGVVDAYAARVWLQTRGVLVDQAHIIEAIGDRPSAPPPVALPPVVISAPPAIEGGQWTDNDDHSARLAACASKRDQIRYAYAVLGSYDQAAAYAWLTERGIEVVRSEVNAVARKAANGLTGSTDEYPVIPTAIVGTNR